MTKKAFNKLLVKFQQAGVIVKIEEEKQLGPNYKTWKIKLQNGIIVVRVDVFYNIANDEIGCKMPNGNSTNIYRIGELLGLKFVMEI